ncbi:hypothetical protein LXA43DRAFT_1102090 [Ganoderma leucocontextum]|nr:hypothetical protein LXA43DRAFT_1102090 [Ganoderma leucocontextum]
MEDTQAVFASQYQTYSPFDIDMMKDSTPLTDHTPPRQQRSMDTAGGPDAKKARCYPTSFNGANGLPANGSASAGPSRDAFANYGYSPQAAAQNGFNGSPPAASNFAVAAAANAAL